MTALEEPGPRPRERTQLNKHGAARQWTATADGPSPHPRVTIISNVSISTDDGVVLKAKIYRPADASGQPVTAPLPVLLNLTPYNKSLVHTIARLIQVLRTAGAARLLRSSRTDLISDLAYVLLGGTGDVLGWNPALVRSGYVQVVVDVRGTGSSTGVWAMLDGREQRDTACVVEWAKTQPWCDGSVGMYGVSYSGINTMQAAGNRIPGLDAVFAVVPTADIRRDLAKTGGVNTLFTPAWMLLVALLKWVPSSADVLLGGIKIRWLIDRLRAPLNSLPRYIYEGWVAGAGTLFDDDARFASMDARIENIDIPTFVYGTWDDLFGPAAMRIQQQFTHIGGRSQVLVSDGYHLTQRAGLGAAAAPPRIDVLQRAWFDKWLKKIDNGIDQYGPITLKQQSGEWHTLDSFPRTGATPTRLYLDAEPSSTADHAAFDGSLTVAAPLNRSEHRLRRQLRLISPTTTRVMLGLTEFLGSDARAFERTALTFTGDPAARPWQLSGPLCLHLRTKAFGKESFWVVTVNDVAPNGFSRMLAEGALLASRRGIDQARSIVTQTGDYLSPYHPTDSQSRLPVTPDVPLSLDIDLTLVDTVIRRGHRLRVVIAAGSWPRFVPSVPELWRSRQGQAMLLDPDDPSYLMMSMVAGEAAGSDVDDLRECS